MAARGGRVKGAAPGLADGLARLGRPVPYGPAAQRAASPGRALLYFSYGSNLHRAGMLLRCPAAVPLGRASLADHMLAFRPWADVEPRPGGTVAGALWRITPACAAALDDYEEVAAGLYRRVILPVRPEGAAEDVEAMAYRMAAAHTAPPEPDHLAAVLRGCRDFGIDEGPVLAAAAAAGWDASEIRAGGVLRLP